MLNHLQKIGSRISKSLQQKHDFGVNHDVPPIKKIQNYFHHHKLESLFPYRSYDAGSQLFYNATGVGFVLEFAPLCGCTEEMQREIGALFQNILPEGSQLQFLLWADPKIDSRLDYWEGERKGKTYKHLAQMRVEHLKGVAQSQESSTPARDFTCIISYSEEIDRQNPVKMEAIKRVKQQIITCFDTLNLGVLVWDAARLMATLDGILRFYEAGKTLPLRWNPYENINTQISYPGYDLSITKDELLVNGGAHSVRTYSVRHSPEYWSLFAMIYLLGDEMRDSMKLTVPFILHYGIRVCGQDRVKSKIQSKEDWVEAQARSKVGKKIPILGKQSKEFNFIREQLSKGERFLQSSFNVCLFSKIELLESNEHILKSIFRTKGWDLVGDTYLHLPSFLSTFPMTWGEGLSQDLIYHKRLKTTISSEAANLLPIQGEWKGTPTPGMLFLGRRGQVCTWSPFDNNQGNYNVAVVGRSGSGKSVFMQDLMTSILGLGGRVFVLDVGRSFEKLVKLLGGQYIEFTPHSNLCINPFTSIPCDRLEESMDSLSMLRPVLSLMAAPVEGTTDLENAWLDKALNDVWSSEGSSGSIGSVAKFLSLQKNPIATELAEKLHPYTATGAYGRFFNGPATVNLSDDLVVVELEELKERKDLQSVVVQIIILQITNKLYGGDRKTPSALVLDEAWDLLRGKQSGLFIETAARRLRKYKGSLIVGTQSINDFYATPGAQAAFDNSDWMCLLSQKRESIEQLKKSSRLSMDKGMEEALNSLKTRQGEYAEVLIYGPHGYATVRLILDPYSVILYSTKPEEFAAVQELVLKGIDLKDAITQISQKQIRSS